MFQVFSENFQIIYLIDIALVFFVSQVLRPVA